MKITKVFLKNYTPMSLNGFESIDINIDKSTLLVLGTNGCGKSSLLRICTPLPAPIAEFGENGEMVLECEHNGNFYKIVSVYKKGARYSLFKNDMPVHENVNGTLHRDVIVKEFGYTALMHKVLIGDLLFTEMKAAERKEVLMAICPVELQYITQVYRSAKTSLRDTVGVLKHISVKRSDILTKLQRLEVPVELENERAEIEQELQHLVPFINNDLPPSNAIKQTIENEYVKLNYIKKQLDRFSDQRVPYISINSVSGLNEYIGSCNGQIQAMQTQIGQLCNNIDEINSPYVGLLSSEISIEEIMQRKELIEVSLESMHNSCYVNSNHAIYLSNLNNILSASADLWDSVDMSVFAFNSVDISAEYNTLHSNITEANTVINRAVALIEHTKKDMVEGICPKCSHKFNISGTSAEETIQTSLRRIEIAKEYIAKNQERYTFLVETISKLNELNILINKVNGLRQTYKMPFTFWEKYEPRNYLKLSVEVRQHIQLWKNDIENGINRNVLLDELAIINNSITFHNRYSSGAERKVKSLEQDLNVLLTNQDVIKKQRDIAIAILRNIMTFTTYSNDGNTIIENIDNNFIQLTDALISENAKEICSRLYTKLSESKVIIDRWNNLTETVKGLDVEYEALLHQQEAWELLVENLSPSTGVIADQMLGFIDSYTQQMNNVLQNIFSYTLRIHNCDMDNGVLDYTFPLQSEDSCVKDINMGSKGQKEIINMAFMLVMRHYLKLTEFPLFLDETGAGFDKQHRDNLMSYIKRILNDGMCSQLFFINHYADMHGGLVHHDTLVLNPNNIITPSVYNTNVNITYR